MANILASITSLLNSCIAGDPPPPQILLDIEPRLNELTAVTADPSGNGIASWLAKLRSITGDTRLQETLIVRALQMHFPRLAETLTLLGIIGYEWDGEKPAAFSVNWNQLDALMSRPGELMLQLLLSKVQKIEDLKAMQALMLLLISSPRPLLTLEYKKQGFASLPLEGQPGVSLEDLMNLIHSPLRLPLPFTPPVDIPEPFAGMTTQPPGPIGYLSLEGPVNFNKLEKLGIEVMLKAGVTLNALALGDGWQLTFSRDTNDDKKYRIAYNTTEIDTNITSEGGLTIFLDKNTTGNALLIGDPAGTHFAVQSIRLGVELRPTTPVFNWKVNLQRISFALKPDFLQMLDFGFGLPPTLEFDSDVTLSYVQGKGLSGQGAGDGVPALGVQFTKPLNLKLGGLTIDQVLTRMEVKPVAGGLRFRVMFRYGANVQLGPLSAKMDGAGVWLGHWLDGNGGLLPPQGIGLSLEAGPVNGGGFLKIVGDQEFAGAMQLKILGIGAFAYGILKTLPGGGISFVALIGIRLPLPGIQLGFGFAVTGFGGLVGVNRRANTDLLRERLASGAATNVLFNDDPVKNAPVLLGDMQQFFPEEQSIFLIGPTLQANWLYILKLDMGVFIELPGPRQIFIAGSARLVLGSEEFALVYLRMNFIGGIVLTHSLIFFDAALENSHVLGVFRITGGMALRIGYGDNGYFLFSVGGFNSSFHPAGLELPAIARAGCSFSLGPVWMKLEIYLAVTPNTFQLGGKVEAGLDLGPIDAHGWFVFDALIQFKPFYFEANIDAGFDVRALGVSMCSVRVEGKLTGPGPLVLHARASVRRIVKISGSITVELNNNPPETLQLFPNLPEYLHEELEKPDNLRFEGEDNSVVFAPADSGQKLFAPTGELVWEQKRVPLHLAIEKFEGMPLDGWHTLQIGPAPPATFTFVKEDDWFGVGTYMKLNDAEALNTARLSQQQSGIRITGSEMRKGPDASKEIKIKLIKLPKRSVFSDVFSSQYLNKGLINMLDERNGGAKLDAGAAKVQVHAETWNAHDHQGQQQNSDPLNSVQAFVAARQTGGVALPVGEQLFNLAEVL